MKIAFIVDAFPTLSETFIINQVTGLLDRGHDVEVFASHKPRGGMVHPEVLEYRLADRVTYYLPQKKAGLMLNHEKSFSLKFTHLLASFADKKFDLIHCHFGPNGILGAQLKRMGVGGRLVTSFYGYDLRVRLAEGRCIYKELFRRADYLLPNCDYNRMKLIRFGASPEKIMVHRLGVDLGRFPYRKPREKKGDEPIKNWRPKPPVLLHEQTGRLLAVPSRGQFARCIKICTVARLVEEKGLGYGIDAVAKLLQEKPRLKLKYAIIGGGPMEQSLKKRVESLKLGRVVEFLGPMERDRVIRNLKDADIFLLPSVAEGLPVVLIEAQALGIPAVASSVGGVPEVLVDGETGFLAPEKNAEAIAEKIGYLIEHPKVRSKMGERGRQKIEAEYDAKKQGEILAGIYRNLVGGEKCRA